MLVSLERSFEVSDMGEKSSFKLSDFSTVDLTEELLLMWADDLTMELPFVEESWLVVVSVEVEVVVAGFGGLSWCVIG